MGAYIAIAMDESKIQDIETVNFLLGLLDLNMSSLSIISVIIIILFAARLIFAILINRKILYFLSLIFKSASDADLMQTYQKMPYEEFIDNDSSDAIANTTILTMNFTNNVLYTILKAFAEIVLALFLLFLISINGLLVLILSMGLGFLIFAYNNFLIKNGYVWTKNQSC